MKKPILIIISLVCLLFMACTGRNNLAINDSLKMADTNALNLKKQFPDSLQNKIVGNIKFGISETQYMQMYKQFLKGRHLSKRYWIGNFSYLVDDPEYYHNKLYLVELLNPWIEDDDQLSATVKGAYDVVSAQYGKPDTSNEIGTILKGYSKDLYIWHIGRKQIKIVASYPFNMYSVAMIFTDTSLAQRLHTDDSLHSDSVTKVGKKDL